MQWIVSRAKTFDCGAQWVLFGVQWIVSRAKTFDCGAQWVLFGVQWIVSTAKRFACEGQSSLILIKKVANFNKEGLIRIYVLLRDKKILPMLHFQQNESLFLIQFLYIFQILQGE